jgi:cell division protein FtsI (penicillin-binding protein 3)
MAEKKKDILWRVYLVFAGFLVFGLAIIFKVAKLQVTEGASWKKKANEFTLKYQNIDPIRGNIYAADGSLLATSLPRYDVYLDVCASKKDVFDDSLDSLAYCLSAHFKDRSKSAYKRILSQARRDKDRYFLLKRNVSFTDQKVLKQMPILRLGKNKGGLVLTQLSRREKPFKLLAARTIGFNLDNKKVASVGIESSYDSELRGSTGKRLMQRLSGNVWKPVNDDNEIEPMDGRDVITTIDVNLQDVAESALMRILTKNEAEGGCAILMEVQTGEIKAIANLRRNPGDGQYDEKYNYAIGQSTEPGSTFKLASLMAAMEDGYVEPDHMVDAQGGIIYWIPGKPLRDSHEGTGVVTVKKAFALSSNVALSKLIHKYYSKNPQAFVDRLNKMHLTDDLGMNIPGAGKAMIRSASDKHWTRSSLPYLSIGYESMLTPMHLLTFYNAVANNGKMVAPVFVKEIKSKGLTIKSFGTKVMSDSIASASTIRQAREVLEEVVLHGTASHIKNDQYSIAGKTGTAVIAQGADGYTGLGKKYQASFCGYFPADKPQYSCIVVVYAPSKEAYYGSSIACPVFKEIADKVYALNVKMHEELQRVPDSIYAGDPLLKPGRGSSATVIVKKLKLEYPQQRTGWVNAMVQPVSPPEGEIPNVVGMGLRDAMYLLESQGVRVKPMGRGKVVKQSITPGIKIDKGQQIILELS